jgi:hypothetical protein
MIFEIFDASYGPYTQFYIESFYKIYLLLWLSIPMPTSWWVILRCFTFDYVFVLEYLLNRTQPTVDSLQKLTELCDRLSRNEDGEMS